MERSGRGERERQREGEVQTKRKEGQRERESCGRRERERGGGRGGREVVPRERRDGVNLYTLRRRLCSTELDKVNRHLIMRKRVSHSTLSDSERVLEVQRMEFGRVFELLSPRVSQSLQIIKSTFHSSSHVTLEGIRLFRSCRLSYTHLDIRTFSLISSYQTESATLAKTETFVMQ